ncbi:MAG: cell division protease FtsH [Paracoccaceae bacterium]
MTGDEIKKVMAGEPIHLDDDEDDKPDTGKKSSVTAVPKTTKPKAPKDPGMEPEPSA